MKTLLGFLAIALAIDVAYSGGPMFKFGAGHGDIAYGAVGDNDDGFEPFRLGDTYRFFRKRHEKIYIGSNGYVTFGGGETENAPHDPYPNYGNAMIAPYWSDIYLDTSRGSKLWYRESTEPRFVEKAQDIINNHFAGCGDLFVPTSVFIVTWENVFSYCEEACPWDQWDVEGCFDDFASYHDYNNKRDISAKPKPKLAAKKDDEKKMGKDLWWLGTNTFQLVLATDGDDTFAIFYMKKINWPFCFEHNRMLFNAGDGTGFYMNPVFPTTMLPYSSNVAKAGRWAYKISESKIKDPDCQNLGS